MRPQKDRTLAEVLFVNEGKSLSQIAAALGACKKTILNWSREGSWMKRRQQRRRESPRASLDVLKRLREVQVQALDAKPVADADGKPAAGAAARQIPDPAAIATLYRLNMAIAKMEAQQEAIGPMLDGFERFTQFVASQADADACEVIREWIGKFLDEERRRKI
ncbi:MAG: hypothetical protein ABSA67_15610 [Candidatus Brocadiia bacterium]|jgi:hypothetical protein